MIHSTSKMVIVRENELMANRIILPGALVLPEDRTTVQWNMNYDQAPLGFARLFERTGNEITATIDWISDRYKAFFDADGTFSKDWFELAAYITEVKLDADDEGNFVVKSGIIRAVSVVPLPGFPAPKEISNAKD